MRQMTLDLVVVFQIAFFKNNFALYVRLCNEFYKKNMTLSEHI